METANSKDAIIKRMVELYSDGKDPDEVSETINKERKNTMFNRKSKWIKEAQKFAIMQIIVPSKEYFMKESLIQYEEIKEESKQIDERDKGLTIQLKALKDRNELLGLTKVGGVIEVNFTSDISDNEFLSAQNKIIDVTPQKDILDEKPEME